MLSFTNGVGNLFSRLGRIGKMLAEVREYQLAQLVNMTDTTYGVVAQFDAESDIQAIMGSSYIGLLDAGGSNILSTAQTLANQTVNRMVFRDNPRLNQTLTDTNTTASLVEIIRQMRVAGASVLAMTVGASASAFTGVGNGTVVCSVRRPVDGAVLENAFAENLLTVCSSDSYVGGATAGNEGFTVTGTGSQGNYAAFNWPLGSNCQIGLSAIDGSQDDSAGNLLTSSSFESFTNNVPDNWTLEAGTAGTNIAYEQTITFDGGGSLAIIGDGSTLTEIRQQFDSSTGTSGILSPLSQYAFNVWARRDGTAPAAGVITVDLCDSTGTVVNDMAGNPCSFTIDCTTLLTTWAPFSGTFRTPLVMPASTFVRVRLSTALTNGRTVYLDRAGMGAMQQAYLAGPFLAVFSGATPFNQNDYATVAVTNSRGAGGSIDTFQTLFARLFPSAAYSLGLLLPSSNVATISDTLITGP